MNGRRLKIALIAHVRFPIAPPFMGGMEVHSWHLADALIARGHDVTLLASGDSSSSAEIVPIVGEHYDRTMPWHVYRGTSSLAGLLDTTYQAAWRHIRDGDFDVVHNNSLHPFPIRASRIEGRPMLTSLHVPPFAKLQNAVRKCGSRWMPFSACSEGHRSLWWSSAVPETAHVVPNGISVSHWPFVPIGDGSAVWSGRITPTKGTHLAIDAARALGIDLSIFGAIENRDYFDTVVSPRLGDGVRYGGHLRQPELAAEMGRASLCFFTPLWDEPFGLVAAEAMMCGVPVAALPHGATEEVVGPGGAIAAEATAESLALAGARAMRIPRAEVHSYAASVFSIDRMVSSYERLYNYAIVHGSRRRSAPGEARTIGAAALAT